MAVTNKTLTVLEASQNYHIRGGADTVVFMTIDLLRKHGHHVVPFAAAHPANLPSDWNTFFPIAANFETPRLKDLILYIYSRPALNAIGKLADMNDLDVAHLHIYYGKLTTSILAALKAREIPIVQTLHEYKLICPVYSLFANGQVCESCAGQYFWRAIPKRCNRNSLLRTVLSVTESYVSRMLGNITKVDHFIAVSNFVRNKMVHYGIPESKITTVYNCINYDNNTVPNHQPGSYFLYVGRLERFKGLEVLIEASAGIAHIPLLIVGDGNYRAILEQLVEQRELKHIRFLGFKRGNELAQIIRGSLCTLLPSTLYETFGLTILEGFVHSRPAIASRIGGIPEVITDGVDGFLVEPASSHALREKMVWMANNPLSAVEMGLKGLAKVREHFSPEIHYENLMQVYRKVL